MMHDDTMSGTGVPPASLGGTGVSPVPVSSAMHHLERSSPVKIRFGAGHLAELGALARAQSATRALLVTDPGIVSAGHAARAAAQLEQSGITVTLFDGTRENPTTEHVAAGLAATKRNPIDLIVAIGGGSAMDCAKGVNLLYSGGGQMADYHGDPPTQTLAARPPLLPMILIPTTAGTGSEAQSFALISDAATKRKMACGDRRPPDAGGLRPRAAILDPDLLPTQPPDVAAAAGIDAIAHAVETAASRRRNDDSRRLSAIAWSLLTNALPAALADLVNRLPTAQSATQPDRPDETHEAWSRMLLGAHAAGAAIELSMLGAAHACANPLTARFGIAHGVAVGLMLPHVVRFNASGGENPYADLDLDAGRLARRIEELLETAGFERSLADFGVDDAAAPQLAEEAAAQWTAGFNPRPVGAAELLEIYRAALHVVR